MKPVARSRYPSLNGVCLADFQASLGGIKGILFVARLLFQMPIHLATSLVGCSCNDDDEVEILVP